MSYICRLLLVLLSIMSQVQAQGELEIFIDTGVENTLPVAVIPFGWDGAPGAQPVDLHRTIANDLARSGRFATMDDAEMPQQPVEYAHVNFSDWQLLRMENIVIGKLAQTETGDFEVEFRLLDVYKGTQLTGFRINGHPQTTAPHRAPYQRHHIRKADGRARRIRYPDCLRYGQAECGRGKIATACKSPMLTGLTRRYCWNRTSP